MLHFSPPEVCLASDLLCTLHSG